MTANFPTTIYIDDKCDACGIKDVRGVSFGAGKPVICRECLVRAEELFYEPPEPDSPEVAAAMLKAQRLLVGRKP
jgi:hypothetical protein